MSDLLTFYHWCFVGFHLNNVFVHVGVIHERIILIWVWIGIDYVIHK